MAKYIKKKDLKNAIEECTWYHINKNGELVEGANSDEHEPLYKYSDIKRIIKGLPTRKFEDEPKRTALSKALKWTYGDEPNCSEKPNNCEDLQDWKDRMWAEAIVTEPTISKMEQVDKPTTQTETQNSNLTFEKDECAKEYEELGLKELKELIKADRKTEPNSSEKPNNSDTISRQAAISAICNACGKIDCDKMDKCEKLQLPPANCSEFPNNCEHITEDGVTCAKYPACDDCIDNPLNKVKGSERSVKGSEQTDCQTCKWWSSYGYCVHRECKGYEPQTERSE